MRFGVYLGDGCRVPCQGVCRELRVELGVELRVELGVCQLTIDGYLFELGRVDLILGIEWLSSLGEFG